MEATGEARRNRRPLVIAAVAGLIAIVLGVVAFQDQAAKASVLATLKPLDDTVSLKSDLGRFEKVGGSETIKQGAEIRTDATGRAQIDFFDGSLTRLGPATSYAIPTLERRGATKEVVGDLDIGRSWHRVQKLSGTGSRFEVKTSKAVAAVRGTAFAVVCLVRDVCEIAVVEGVVEVITSTGERVTLVAGQAVTVNADGSLSDLRPIDPDDPWLNENADIDDIELPGFEVRGETESVDDDGDGIDDFTGEPVAAGGRGGRGGTGTSRDGTAPGGSGVRGETSERPGDSATTPGASPDQAPPGSPTAGDSPRGEPGEGPSGGSPPSSSPPSTNARPSDTPPSNPPGQGSPPTTQPPSSPPSTQPPCPGGGYPPRPC